TRLVRAHERVGPGTIRVLLAAPFEDQVLAGGTGWHDALTQLTAEHGNEPRDGPAGWLTSRQACTPRKPGGTGDRCSGQNGPEQPRTRNRSGGQPAGDREKRASQGEGLRLGG